MKRTITVGLVCFLLFGLVAGCSKDSGKETGTSDTLEISVATWYVDPRFRNNDDAVYNIVKDKFNITINPIVITWDDYQEKIITWMATNDAPDLFTIDAVYLPVTFRSWIRDKLVRPMPSDLSPYPNLQALFNRPDVKLIQVDGQYWCVPRYKGDMSGYTWVTSSGCYYRKDWAEKLGFGEITSYDQLVAFLRAVVDRDPDGNGIKDTIGMISGYDANFLRMFLWRVFESTLFGRWQIGANGNATRAFDAEHSYDAALAIRNLFNEGLIDPDILIQTTDGGFDKFAANKAGAVAFQMFSNDELLFDKFIANNPDKKIEDCIGFINVLPNVYDGKYYVPDNDTSINFWAEVYIPHTVSDAKYERIIPFLDFTTSTEWIDLCCYGIEGVDYRREGNEIRFLTADGSRPIVKDKYLFINGFMELTLLFEGRRFNEFYTKYPYVAQMANQFHDWAAANGTPAPDATTTFFMINTPLAEEFVDESDTMLQMFMFGGSTGDPRTEWARIMQSLKDAGVEPMMAEMNEAAREAGRLK